MTPQQRKIVQRVIGEPLAYPMDAETYTTVRAALGMDNEELSRQLASIHPTLSRKPITLNFYGQIQRGTGEPRLRVHTDVAVGLRLLLTRMAGPLELNVSPGLMSELIAYQAALANGRKRRPPIRRTATA